MVDQVYERVEDLSEVIPLLDDSSNLDYVIETREVWGKKSTGQGWQIFLAEQQLNCGILEWILAPLP